MKILHHAVLTSLQALIDSGADKCMMDWGLAEQLGLHSERLTSPTEAKALNGCNIFTISHRTETVELCIGNHKEHIPFLLFYFIKSDPGFGLFMAPQPQSKH